VREDLLRRSLREPAPGEAEAGERSWEVVRAAFALRAPSPRPPRVPLRAALILAAAVAVAVAAVTPPGRAVLGEIRDAVGRERVVGVERAKPALVSLPAPGRLLVVSERGPWVVQRDGSKRRLGAYEDATWSPRGLFVAATRGRTLVALDPKGTVRWSLSRPEPVSDARWAPSGLRITYRSGGSLRVVAGDGTGDRLLARRTSLFVAPTWRPGSAHVVSYADASGRVRTVNADTGRELWRPPPGPVVRFLEWTRDGRFLLAVSDADLRLYRGRRVRTRIEIPRTHELTRATLEPGGTKIAYAIRERATKRASLFLYTGADSLLLFEGAGRFRDLTWSPDGRWLAFAWPAADQLIFVRVADRKVVAVSNVAREFDPGGIGPVRFPRLSGWCCP